MVKWQCPPSVDGNHVIQDYLPLLARSRGSSHPTFWTVSDDPMSDFSRMYRARIEGSIYLYF